MYAVNTSRADTFTDQSKQTCSCAQTALSRHILHIPRYNTMRSVPMLCRHFTMFISCLADSIIKAYTTTLTGNVTQRQPSKVQQPLSHAAGSKLLFLLVSTACSAPTTHHAYAKRTCQAAAKQNITRSNAKAVDTSNAVSGAYVITTIPTCSTTRPMAFC
eukprot:GHRR01011239.1.p1 GENE.GHRR01011239.1~~GHRR01011239.1.p1  ORF type:complete len:160 (-),score=43.31 GHRR01011239.1:797-1276(-)